MEAQGDPINGSRYYRDFCCGCRDPIRVLKEDVGSKWNYCSSCSVPTRAGTRHFAVPKSERAYNGSYSD